MNMFRFHRDKYGRIVIFRTVIFSGCHHFWCTGGCHLSVRVSKTFRGPEELDIGMTLALVTYYTTSVGKIMMIKY